MQPTLSGTAAISGTIDQASITSNGGGTATLSNTINTSGGITVSGTGSLTSSSGISGAGGITVGTTGTVIVAGANSFDGNIVVNSGTFRPNSSTGFGSTVGTTTVNPSGSVFVTAQNTDYGTEAITISGTGTGNNGALHTGGATVSTFGGLVTVGGNTLLNLDGGSTLSLTNASALTAAGPNIPVTASGGGTVRFGGNVNLGTGGVLALTTTGSLANGNANFAPPAATTINSTAVITGGGAISVTTGGTPDQTQLGTTVLSSNPTYSGAITVSSGNLRVQSSTTLGTSTGAAITTITGSPDINNVVGSLQLAPTPGSSITSAESFTVNARQGPGIDVPHIQSISGDNTLTAPIITPGTGGTDYNFQSDSGSLTIQSNFSSQGLGSLRNLKLQGAGSGVWNGLISDTAAAPVHLFKTGTGTWRLNASNSYRGNTTVAAGTLLLGTNNAIGGGGAISNLNLGTGSSSGTLATGGFSNTFGQLNVLGNSTLDLGNGASTINFADSSVVGWTGNLSVLHWTSGVDHLVFGDNNATLTSTQLAQIVFPTYTPAPAIISPTGEVTPGLLTRVLTQGDWSMNGMLDSGDLTAGLKALTNLDKWRTDNNLDVTQMNSVGDYNGGGVTNLDLQLLINALSTNGLGSVAAVPEPSTVALLLIGLAAGVPMLRARRRSNH